ncbi:MAG: hypothetical protein NZ942_01685 [Candidatus Aenigmarchaeota archaeon]|nr:hypothetical protein [Candidatus Aenigmarchaeota archaeon]
MKAQARIDEFAFVLLAGLVLIIVMMVAWTTTTAEFLEVTPSSISIKLEPGSSQTIELNLNGTATNVTFFATGDVKRFISFSKQNFDVSGSEVVAIDIYIPTLTVEKVYRGSIQITFTGGNKSIPVTINVTKLPVQQLQRNFYFGDFSVSHSVGSEILASKHNFEVSKGYFSDYSSSLTHESLSEEKLQMVTGGFIKILVDETNNAGNLIVEFNGEEVYNKNTNPGEVFIELNSSKIKKSNVVTIKAGLPGWKFWMNTVYRISSAKFGIYYYGVSEKISEFELGDKEVNNFKYAWLSARVKDSNPTRDLIIKINDKEVYKTNKKAADLISKVFYPGEINLRKGINLISFSTEPPDGFYELADVTLSVVYTS